MAKKVLSHEPRKRHLRQPAHSKGLTKLVILLPQMLCIALQPRQKLDMILVKDLLVLVNKMGLKGVSSKPSGKYILGPDFCFLS